MKNKRLEKLGHSIKQMLYAQANSEKTSNPSVNNIEVAEEEPQDNEVNIGQNGDIINRYRIPIEDNEVDVTL